MGESGVVQDAACRRGQEKTYGGRFGCKEGVKIGSSREVAASRGATSWGAETQGEWLPELGWKDKAVEEDAAAGAKYRANPAKVDSISQKHYATDATKVCPPRFCQK